MLFRLQRAPDAMEEFSKVLTQAGPDSRVLQSRGLSCQAVGDHEKAIEVRWSRALHTP